MYLFYLGDVLNTTAKTAVARSVYWLDYGPCDRGSIPAGAGIFFFLLATASEPVLWST
jgi:hypothetical protein